VQKTILARASWLGALSEDTLVREVSLWTSGLLPRLPRCIATGVLEARMLPPDPESGGAAGCLIMRDLAASHLRDQHGRPLREPPLAPPGTLPPVVLTVLRQLSKLHAAFWEDPHLDDTSTGLMSSRDALLFLGPERLAARLAEGDPAPYLPVALAGWEAFFGMAAPDDAETLMRVYQTPDTVLPAIEALPRTLVHGDVWGPNLGRLPGGRRAPRAGRQLLLLDWELATAAPPTYDVLWLSGTWHALFPQKLLAAYRAQLERRLASHGIFLSPDIWRGLVDAGYLRTALTCGEALARSAAQAPAGALRRRMEARVRWWAARAAAAAHRMSRVTSRLQLEDGA
jgi:Phosphotransferase enzyme family